MFIESLNTPISDATVRIRIEQLADKDSLIPTTESEIHMARIDLLDAEVIIYGSDLVDDLRKFLHEKADARVKQLLVHGSKSQ